MNKQNRNRLIETEDRLMVVIKDGVWGTGWKGEGTEKYKLAVTKQLQGCEVQHREYSQQYCGNCARYQVGT